MFKSAAENSYEEFKARTETSPKLMRFGVSYLDDALVGIFPDDLILMGAASGVGKTQLCCNIALANIIDSRKVHYIALEASQFEIERRLKFPMFMDCYLKDPNRPHLKERISYPDWLMGKYVKKLELYEEKANIAFQLAFPNLYLYYKQDRFGLLELIESVSFASEKTDLIIIDHVHYFDYDDDNENRAIKEIAKTVRSLALEQQKPIVLVAHLRKRDRHNDDLIAGLDEFHGSSDLYKIATRVITVAPGPSADEGLYETYFRTPKNRIDGGVIRYAGKEFFNPKTGGYERDKYQVGWASQSRSTGFVTIDEHDDNYPEWGRAKKADRRRGGNDNFSPDA